MKSLLNLQSLFLLLLIICHTHAQFNTCKKEHGCLLRTKYFSYVSFQSQAGLPVPFKSSFDNKIIYVFEDRLVFYRSLVPMESGLEMELKPEIPKAVDEANIERIIYFSEITLDCGTFNNKLCYARDYPQIEKLETYKKIESKINTYPHVKCIVIPFFENSYKVTHEKVAFICVDDVKQILELIKFRQFLSRAIEGNHFLLGSDRFNSFNGLLRNQTPFIYFSSDSNHKKPVNVLARLFGKKVILVTNDKVTHAIKEVSLYQYYNEGIYSVKGAIKRGLINNDWNSDLEIHPYDDCCLVFPGDESVFLCAVNNNQTGLEQASDICSFKMKPFKKAVRIQSYAIQLSENNEILLLNKAKLNNCKSKEFDLYKRRVIEALKTAAMVDCKIIMKYGAETLEQRLNNCKEHYSNEIKAEMNLISGTNSVLSTKISECTYTDKDISPMMKNTFLFDLLKRANIYKEEKEGNLK